MGVSAITVVVAILQGYKCIIKSTCYTLQTSTALHDNYRSMKLRGQDAFRRDTLRTGCQQCPCLKRQKTAKELVQFGGTERTNDNPAAGAGPEGRKDRLHAANPGRAVHRA